MKYHQKKLLYNFKCFKNLKKNSIVATVNEKKHLTLNSSQISESTVDR